MCPVRLLLETCTGTNSKFLTCIYVVFHKSPSKLILSKSDSFQECFSETIRFLEKSKIGSTIVHKLTEHMKQFQQNVELPTSFSQAGVAMPSSVMLVSSNGGGGSTSVTSSSIPSSVEEEPVKLFPIASTKGLVVVEPSHTQFATFALNVPRLRREASFSPPTSSSTTTTTIISRAKKAPSSTHSQSSCLSPSAFSNDSNNNHNTTVVLPPSIVLDGFLRDNGDSSPPSGRTIITEQGGGYPHHHHPGSVESFERVIRPQHHRQHHHHYHHHPSKQIMSTTNMSSPPVQLLDDSTIMLLRPTPRTTDANNAYVLNLSTHTSSTGSSSYNHNYYNMSPGGESRSARQEEGDDEPMDEEFSEPLNLSKHEVMYRLEEDGVWRPW